MEQAPANGGGMLDSAKGLSRRLAVIARNRLELLLVEIQEERERGLRLLFLATAGAACGFMALLAFNVAIVVLLWNTSPVAVLLIMAGLYAACAGVFYWRVTRVLQDWKMLAATVDQLRKDRECLEKNLS